MLNLLILKNIKYLLVELESLHLSHSKVVFRIENGYKSTMILSINKKFEEKIEQCLCEV